MALPRLVHDLDLAEPFSLLVFAFDTFDQARLGSDSRPDARDGLVSRDVLPGMNAGASLSAVPSPIEGSGTAWVLLGSWALRPARPTPIPPRHECRGFSALLVMDHTRAG